MKEFEQSISISPLPDFIPTPISQMKPPLTRRSARNHRSLFTTVPFLKKKPELIRLSSFPQAENQQKGYALGLLIEIHSMGSFIERLQGLVDDRLNYFLNIQTDKLKL